MQNQTEIQKLIAFNQLRLQKLKERKALSGIDTSPQILIEIESIEAEIESLQKQLEALNQDNIPPSPLTIPRRPFKPGLTPFEVEDQDIFFGREQVANGLFNKILQQRLTVVIGSSGSGKSSLIKAGVIPRLRKEGYPVVYSFVQERITDDVLRGINIELSSNKKDNVKDLQTGIHCLPNGKPIVLIVDQFEQALRNSHDLKDLNSFLQEVTPLLRAGKQLVKVVVVIRSDWFGILRQTVGDILPELDRPFSVNFLTKEESYIAITSPLKQQNISYEESVIDDIIGNLLNCQHPAAVENHLIQPAQL